MNWGKSIVLVFVLFAGFIGTLVYLMTRERIDLVRDDYYQDELTYQQHIDRVRQTVLHSAAIALHYQSHQQQICFCLPDSLRQATFTFYRPADRQADFRVDIGTRHATRRMVSTTGMAKGHWRVQMNWSDGHHDYYNEADFFIK